MISGRKYQGLSGFRIFTRRVKSLKQAKFRLPDIQSVYLKKTAQFRSVSVASVFCAETHAGVPNLQFGRIFSK
jgi:hypothetical protein